MTLRAKFLDINEIANYNHFNILTNKLEKIADDFAIGFAEWLVITYNEDIIYDEYTTKELLTIYKKEKQL